MEKKYLVLIVDDHKDNRTFLRKLLESTGHIVLEAENGQTALEAARIQKPDLIISDILMPVMDGYKLCMEVKNDEKLKSVPFIFYTATYTEKKDEEFALSLGASKFLVKPEEPEVLIKIIKSYLKEFANGKLSEPINIVKDETETFKLYSERLVNKLEQKMIELENEIKERKKNDLELQTHRENLEDTVKERTAELEKKNAELERFNKVFVEREFRIKELKDRVKELEEKLKENGIV